MFTSHQVQAAQQAESDEEIFSQGGGPDDRSVAHEREDIRRGYRQLIQKATGTFFSAEVLFSSPPLESRQDLINPSSNGITRILDDGQALFERGT